MQYGFVAERICAYYNFASCLCYSCTESQHTLPTHHFCAREVCARGFVAVRICAYYNFASRLCYSCTDTPPHFCSAAYLLVVLVKWFYNNAFNLKTGLSLLPPSSTFNNTSLYLIWFDSKS
jgi:hypothetical protein